MLNVVLLSVFKLSVIYARCRLFIVIMPSVVTLNVIEESVVMLNVA